MIRNGLRTPEMFSISSRFLGSYLNAMDEYGNIALICASHVGHGNTLATMVMMILRASWRRRRTYGGVAWRHRKYIGSKPIRSPQIHQENEQGYRAIPRTRIIARKKRRDVLRRNNNEDMKMLNVDKSCLIESLQEAELSIECHAEPLLVETRRALHVTIPGHVEVVQELLENDEVDVNARCTDDKTPLYVASENGHEKVARKLLECVDVEVNAQCTADGKTALYIASENGHADVVRELLQDGDDDVEVDLRCTDGKTALIIASENGHVEVVRLLHQNDKVDVNARCMNT
ncbi:hypothetical protein MHU86_21879 [Fragilaria crotonensis]|nr:hypothetical protein MHU86_21879 [Fragilaria crotonensis]